MSKDQQEWKIPPCISNWKNSKGYTRPLEKLLAADGRGLQDGVVSRDAMAGVNQVFGAEARVMGTSRWTA